MSGFQYFRGWPCTWCNGIKTSMNQYLIQMIPAIIMKDLLSHLTPKSITWERFFLVQFWYGVSITASFQRVRCLLIYWYWVLAVSRSMISKQRTPISNWKGKAAPLTDHQFTICTMKTGPPDNIFNKLFSAMTSPFFCYFAWQVQYLSGVFIGPESDHCLLLSLTHSLLFSKLDWCNPGVWRFQLKTCCCNCCWWGSCWQQFVADLEAEVRS